MPGQAPNQPQDFDLASRIDGDMVVVTFSGRSTERNSRAMTARYFEIVLASGKRKVLADIRQLEGRLSAGETFMLVHELPLGRSAAGLATAILETEAQRAYADFLETVLVNAGATVRCTVDHAAAVAWLRGT